MTDSMKKAIGETERRRAKQLAYNEQHHITPSGIMKEIRDLIDGVFHPQDSLEELHVADEQAQYEVMSEKELSREIKKLEKQMQDYAKNLEFEKAAQTRDQLHLLRERAFGAALIDRIRTQSAKKGDS